MSATIDRVKHTQKQHDNKLVGFPESLRAYPKSKILNFKVSPDELEYLRDIANDMSPGGLDVIDSPDMTSFVRFCINYWLRDYWRAVEHFTEKQLQAQRSAEGAPVTKMEKLSDEAERLSKMIDEM